MLKDDIVIFLTFLSCVASQSTTTLKYAPQSSTTSVSPEETKQCFEDKSGRIRTFKGLNDYQGNRYSFDPRHETYQGNIVTFSGKTIGSLSKNSFISFGSDSIMNIDLHDKEITDIEPGAFLGLFCLQNLNLSQNNMSNLSEGSFEGLANLKDLDLSFNALQEIPDNGLTFVELKSLKVLNLSHNEIKSLNQLAFMTLDNLEILNIGHNKIKTLDARVFNYLASLRQLFLNNNLLVDTSADQWKGLTNLTDLDLSNNEISSFDMSSNYSFVSLKNLNLSRNVFQFINVYGIKHAFPNLISLDLSYNRWFCEDLDALKRGVQDVKLTLPTPLECVTTASKHVTIETPINKSPNPQPVHDYGEDILNQNKMIMDTQKEITETLDDIKGLLVFLFVFIVLCVIVEAAARLGICRSWYSSLVGRSRGYMDAHDHETVGLIPR